MNAPARPFVSASRVLTLRIALALVIGLVATTGSVFFALEKAQEAVLVQRADEARQFFGSTVREADRRFQREGHQFVALLEQGWVLEAESAQLAQARFVAFATAFGGTLV